MVRIIIALLLAFLIGAAYRFFGILPAPPTLLGVGLIFAITVGYIITDRLITRRNSLPVDAASQTARQQSSK